MIFDSQVEKEEDYHGKDLFYSRGKEKRENDMGQWVCKCGQYMNDHKSPDENGYLGISPIGFNSS